MNVSFEKIDRFIEIIKEAKAILEADKYEIMAIFSLQRNKQMRETFINIKNSDKSKEEKQKERLKYIIELWKLTEDSAKRFGFNNIESLAEFRLKKYFNEEAFLKESLITFYEIMACEHGYNFKEEKDINKFIIDVEISLGTKVNESDITNVIQKDIPQIKEIEAEFWSNCPTPSDVEKMCNFYYGRLSGFVDTDTINWFRQKTNDKHPNLKELVLCGLLEEDSFRIIEGCFVMIPAIAAGLCGKIIDFLNKLLPPVYQPIQPQQANNIYLSKRKGMKIDYIRVINCLYELGFFVDEKQNTVNKIDVMKAFGSITNKDLKDYDKDLSRALSDSTALTKNLEIFDALKEKMTEIFNSK